MNDIYQQKKLLREEIKSHKNNFSSEELEKKSKRVIKNLRNYEYFREAKTVMLYWSMPDEVYTHSFIEEILETKQVLLPTIVNDEIIPVEIKHLDQLHEGKFHILEPKDEAFIGKIDLIIVPGIAFDKQGNRLGRGRGFYDRFLKNYKGETVGLSFDFQLVNDVPIEPNDIQMKKIISEKNYLP